jgi:hypothetical protein
MNIAEELKKIVINARIEELVCIRNSIDDKILRLELEARGKDGVLPVDESVLFEAENLLNSQHTFSEKPVTVKLNPIEPSETDLLLESFGS